MKVCDLNGDGLAEIIAGSEHAFFPFQLVILSNSGELISEYWNSGFINGIDKIEMTDLNDNAEVILVGVNNEYNAGFVSIIDPFNVEGTSPQQDPYYTMHNGEPGTEIYYLRFPRSPFRITVGRDEAKLFRSANNAISIGIGPGSVTIGYYELSYGMQVTLFDLTDRFYKFYKNTYPDIVQPKYNDSVDLVIRSALTI